MSGLCRHLLKFVGVSLFMLGTLSAEISFNFEIRPILSKNCIACHGPDENDRKGDVRLDTFEGATEDLGGYAAVVPFNPEESKLLNLVTTSDPDNRMPPPDHGNPLSEKETKLLIKWIAEGAKYETHWSFAPLTPPKLPKTANAQFSDYPIDLFVHQKLKSVGLDLSPPAQPIALLRRLSLDLTGLPPSLEEAHQFARDSKTDPAAAYESALDRLLASPAYGEHWASMWLDMARYADTVGYSGDEHRDIWPWRDWVIKSYNDNMPYDQFIIEQVAGDLLPNATTEQKLATAFNRLTLSNNEGGTNDEEFRSIAVKDRISTTVNSVMGLTMRCAECHTHKYDPISQKEYYEFYAYFNQSADRDHRDDRPRMDLMPMGRENEMSLIRAKIARLKEKATQTPSPWTTFDYRDLRATGGVRFEKMDDGSIFVGGKNAEYPTYTIAALAPESPVTAIRLELLPDRRHNDNVGRSPEGATVLSQIKLTHIAPDGTRTPQKFSKAVADHSQSKFEIHRIIKDTPDENGWAVKHDQDGFKVPRTAVLTLAQALTTELGSQLEVEMIYKARWPRMGAGRIRLATTSVEDADTKFKKKTLDPIRRNIQDLEKKLQDPVRVPIMVELSKEKQRQTKLMKRGSFLQPGEEVSAAVLKTFGALPEGAPNNRLGVAQWLVADENPLTARVVVNRYWARLFGTGIVETEEDFGTQGLLPSHPDLLDWLAADFRDHGWDPKRLIKQITMSAAYRQSSLTNEVRLKKDPRNLLISRGPRHRLSAEVVRDQALSVSGLLTKRLYGPPVYPPSPIKTFTNAFSGSTVWVESKGEDRYRRAIYTYLKRSNPHPLFETFDMASRDVCVLRRLRTNTPLQSFMTLNDVVFVEASQALARLMANHSDDPKEQIKRGFAQVLLTAPNQEQLETLLDLHVETLVDYENDLPGALKMAGKVPSPATETNAAQLAALTVVANILLNLDGFLCK